MQQIPLGRLPPVSRLCLGGGGIGQVWGKTSRDEAVATVRAAIDAGITLFDMAPLYGNGEAESVMGEVFSTGYPEGIQLTTKCMVGGTAASEIESKLTTSLNQSLELMKREHVDVYILHGYVIPDGWQQAIRPNALPHIAVAWTNYIEQVIPAFQRLKQAGKIRAWGITAASVQEANIRAIEAATPPDVVQCIANMLDSPGGMAITSEPAAPREVLRLAHERGIGTMGIRAVAAGSLTDQIDREVKPASAEQQDFDRTAVIRELARELGISTARLAHQYALAMSDVDTVVLGVKNRVELADCVAATEGVLDPDLVAKIDGLLA